MLTHHYTVKIIFSNHLSRPLACVCSVPAAAVNFPQTDKGAVVTSGYLSEEGSPIGDIHSAYDGKVLGKPDLRGFRLAMSSLSGF